MSFWRAKLRATDRNVYYDNQLTNFTNPPIYYGDLHVRNNETVGGDLDVCGNLHVGKDLTATNLIATNNVSAVNGNFYLHNYILIPYGTVIQYAGSTAPGGWLLCDGTLYNRYDFVDLFGAIGYTYGGADNSFNVPDLRGRVGVGAGSGPGLTNRTLGGKSGEETHTLTAGEMPAHTHSLDRRSNPDAGAYDTGNAHASQSCASTTDRSILGKFYTDSTGSGNAHNNMQPYLVINYLIKY